MSRCGRFPNQERLCLVLIYLIYIRHEHYLLLSILFKSWSNGKCYHGTSYPNPRRVSYCPIGTIDQSSHYISSQSSSESSRMNFDNRLLLSTLTRQIVLFEVLIKNSTIKSESNNIWSWAGADCKWILSPCDPTIFRWCRIFLEGSSLNIEIHKHTKQPGFLRPKRDPQDDLLCQASMKFDNLWDHLASEAQRETNCKLIFASITYYLLRAS